MKKIYVVQDEGLHGDPFVVEADSREAVLVYCASVDKRGEYNITEARFVKI